MDNVEIQKPMAVEVDTEQAVTLQVAKSTVTDVRGERETEPTICLLIEENGKETVCVLFTINQVEAFTKQLAALKQFALEYSNNLKVE